MFKDQIIKLVGKVVNSSDISIEAIENESFGDYSSNMAMVMAKKEGKNPRQLAEEISSKLNSDKSLGEIVEKVEVAGPGFVNFWLKKDVLVDNLISIDREKEKYGISDSGKGKTVIVEYSSPNIAKPFTVGHLRSTIIGDAVANLFQAVGYKVLRDNHLGDWGTQFGKQIYAIKAWGDEDKIGKSDNPVKELVSLYVKFHEEAEKDESLEDGAREWFKKLENGDVEARRMWQMCIDWSFIEFDKIYSKLGIKFSKEFQDGRGLGESFFEGRMQVVIDELTKKGLLKEGKEGARLVFFKDDKYPPAMIVKKDGTSLYHTRDLATDKYRKEKYNPDLVVNEVGIEQKLYFEQLYEMEKLLGWYKPGQRVHVGHGLIRFKEGKMSTRKGNVVWMEEVLGEAEKRASKLGSKEKGLNEMVAIGALKYNDLKRESKTEVVFDWDEILNMEGNSGPYLQYAYARIQSVLGKSKKKTFDKFDSTELN
ncbi:MAG: arginine--tRNA ligase, partial [Microgenomates group bacterium]